MAKVLGKAGRYVEDMASKKFRQYITTTFCGSGVLAVIIGMMIGMWIPITHLSLWITTAGGLLLLGTIAVFDRFMMAKLDTIDRQRLQMRRGADGESRIAKVLDTLPDEFSVIHDLTTPFGNIDHVAVGPTGVFIVDAKNWKGVITPDGKGELLQNGKAHGKPAIRPLVARTMSIREQVKILCRFEPPFFQVLLAFPSAWLDAPWGKTGHALCVTDDGLKDCILNRQSAEPIDAKKTESLARAFLALATMDKDFDERKS